MMRSSAILVVCWLWAVPATAREGYVQTRDGKVFEGQVRFESNRVVVANAERDLWAEVALTNLSSVTFTPEPSTATASRWQPITELPAPWMSEDIGSVRRAGGVDYRDGVFRVRSCGTNVLGQSDAFHFVFKPARGVSEIVARVAQVQLTHPWARAGLMMRESLAPDSRNVFLSVTAARGGAFQWRERLGEEPRVTLDRRLTTPCWLKLKRDGNVFTALRSHNGRQWSVLDKLTMTATKDLYVGLAVVGILDGAMNESVFEHVEEGPALRNRWFVPQVQLPSGTVQTGYIERMDDTAIHFDATARKEPVSNLNVANIRFQPVPARSLSMLFGGRAGALLATGEFVDGECRGIEEGRVVLSSVLLGLRRFNLSDEVVAVVLRRRDPPGEHAYELKTVDGSVWLGAEVVIEPGGVLIHELALGPRHIPMHEVLELRRSS
jgi:hypothetical protein